MTYFGPRGAPGNERPQVLVQTNGLDYNCNGEGLSSASRVREPSVPKTKTFGLVRADEVSVGLIWGRIRIGGPW